MTRKAGKWARESILELTDESLWLLFNTLLLGPQFSEASCSGLFLNSRQLFENTQGQGKAFQSPLICMPLCKQWSQTTWKEKGAVGRTELLSSHLWLRHSAYKSPDLLASLLTRPGSNPDSPVRKDTGVFCLCLLFLVWVISSVFSQTLSSFLEGIGWRHLYLCGDEAVLGLSSCLL